MMPLRAAMPSNAISPMIEAIESTPPDTNTQERPHQRAADDTPLGFWVSGAAAAANSRAKSVAVFQNPGPPLL
jgi:hypothetical protein